MTNFMEDKRFDIVIDEIVRDFEANYSSNSWSRLERKLDAVEKDNDQFDEMIAHKLSDYSIPLDTGSFSKFQDKLQQNNSSNIDFRRIKNIAAVIILMLYALQMSNNDYNKPIILESVQLTKNNKTNPQAATIRNLSNPTNGLIANKKSTSANHGKIETSNFQIHHNDSEITNQNFGIKYIFPSIDQSIDFAKNNFFTKKSMNFGITRDYDNDNSEILVNDFTMQFESYQISEKGNANFILVNNTINDQNSVRLKASSNISTEIVSNQQTISNETDIFDKKDNLVPKSKKSIEISALAAPTYCMISTPNDVDMKVPGYKNQAIGYETGFNLGFKKARHEFGLGIKLNSLNYSPKKIVAGENGKSFWLDEISYNFIGIPIFYKYNYYNIKRTNLYITSSVQPNLVVLSDYKFIQNDDVSGSLIKLAEELLETNDFKNTLYAAKEYKNGTFEGGKSNENFSLSMSVGLGLQTEIQNSYSFFIEPSINYTIFKNDFGPNHDKLSFMSLKLGINKTIDL
jgi:hypothetical protein